jgi:hypothetical protein
MVPYLVDPGLELALEIVFEVFLALVLLVHFDAGVVVLLLGVLEDEANEPLVLVFLLRGKSITDDVLLQLLNLTLYLPPVVDQLDVVDWISG